MMDEIVITGSAMLCALGHSKSSAWHAVLSGKCGMGALLGLHPKAFDGAVGARVRGLDPASLNVPPKMARLTNLPSCMLLKAARDAFLEARLDQSTIPGEEISFFAGMGMVDYELEHLTSAVSNAQTGEGELDINRFLEEGYREIYPLWPLFMLNNVGFCQTAISLGIKGENAVFADQADAGAQAIVEGLWAVREKRARAALVGGVSPKISPFSLARARLAEMSITSSGTQEMECRPLSPLRSGTVLGEGGAVLVLESSSAAMARGVPFAARISGYGLACEKAAGSCAPTERAIADAAKQAMARAGLLPSDVDLVIAHGDGTWAGDRHESKAISRLFSARAPEVRVFSSKGSLGHCLAGALALDMVLAVCILEHQVIPPTLNCDPVEEGIEFDLIKGRSQPARLQRILLNARSPEGQCASFVVEACS
jgi:3-oxoacyl-[acyl-carrier-protein] synthase II